MEQYDVLVIGSGAGLKIARAAAARGLNVALVERGPLGGTCLNRGCIPSKMLLYPASQVAAMRHAAAVEVHLASPPSVRVADLVARIQRTVAAMSQEIADSLCDEPRLRLYRGQARFIGPRSVCVGATQLRADKVFIATGATPDIPDLDGLVGTPFWTSTEALACTQMPRSLAVLGGGFIACELGSAYAAFGCDVHFLVRSELLRTADCTVRETFQRVFGATHQMHNRTDVLRVRHDGRSFQVTCRNLADGHTRELQSDALLVATGVRPATDDLELAQTEVRTRAGGWVEVDEHLRTSAAGVWALGDCVGRYLLRHSANREADYLVRHVLDGDPAPIDYGPMPYAIFTEPEIAGLGATEDQLRAAERPYVVGMAAVADSNVGLARQIEEGFCKLLVCPKSRRLLGAHILGPEAATLAHLLIAVMYRDGRLEDLLEMVYIHPALPELVRDAARDAQGRLQAPAK